MGDDILFKQLAKLIKLRSQAICWWLLFGWRVDVCVFVIETHELADQKYARRHCAGGFGTADHCFAGFERDVSGDFNRFFGTLEFSDPVKTRAFCVSAKHRAAPHSI